MSPVNEPEYLVETSEKMSQQWALSDSSIQSLLMVEVDLVVLSRELTSLADMSTRIGTAIRKLRVSPQGMD